MNYTAQGHSNYVAVVSGRLEDLNRNILKKEFSKFGTIKKIYVSEEQCFAKVYLHDASALREACITLNGYLSWNISYSKDQIDKKFSPNINSTVNPTLDNHSNLSNSVVSEIIANDNMEDEYDANYELVSDYVDIHGNPITVAQLEDGDMFVRLSDVKRAGFAIFKSDNFDPILIDKRQLRKEFELHLLTEGRKYLLNAQIRLDEKDVVDMFERVKQKVLSSDDKHDYDSAHQNSRKVDKFGKVTLTHSEESRADHCPKLVPASRQSSSQLSNFQNIGASHSGHAVNNRVSRNTVRDSTSAPNRSHSGYRSKPSGGYDNRESNNRGDSNNWSRNGDRGNNRFNKDESSKRMWDNRASNKDSESQPLRQPNSFVQKQQPRVEASWDMDEPVIKETPPQTVDTTPPVIDIGPKPIPCVRSVSISSVGSNKDKPNSGLYTPQDIGVDKISLPIGVKTKVTVTHTAPRNNAVYYVQLSENADIVNDILVQAFAAAETAKDMSPENGALCLVELEEVWYRGVIKDKEFPQVYLFDYGNQEKNVTTSLKVLPEALTKIPAQAVRITISVQENSESSFKFNVDDEISIVVKKQFPDGTYLVNLENDASASKPAAAPLKLQESEPKRSNDTSVNSTATTIKDVSVKDETSEVPCYLEVPPPIGKLRDGDKIMIVDYKLDRLLVRTKECAKACVDIDKHIASLDKQLVKNPKKDQLVLCSKDGLNGLHRAVITDVTGSVATVDYIDHVGEGKLSTSSLRALDQHLATVPQSLIISPPFAAVKHLNDAAVEFMAELMEKRSKVVAVMPSEDNFDIKLDSGALLSTTIKELNNPKPSQPSVATATKPSPVVAEPKPQPVAVPPPKKEEPAVKTSKVEEVVNVSSSGVKITYDDMNYVQPKLGLSSYMCFTLEAIDNITLLSTDIEHMDHLQTLSAIEVSDSNPYDPEVFEMCLAFYKDPEGEEAWYRGVVTGVEALLYNILFVDYGNSKKLQAKDLRPLSKELKDIPILGITASFMGLPNTDEVLNRLKEEVTDGSMHEINIKTPLNSDLKCGIEIPDVYALFRKEGLIK